LTLNHLLCWWIDRATVVKQLMRERERERERENNCNEATDDTEATEKGIDRLLTPMYQLRYWYICTSVLTLLLSYVR
jgi:hypothetical protein